MLRTLLAASILASALHAAPARSVPVPVHGDGKASSPAVPVPAFDSTRAYRYLKEQCALGPRNPGSEGHKRAIAYFREHFRSLGIPAALQDFTHRDHADGRILQMTNILATVKGKDPRHPGIVLCAHWDTRPRADMESDPRHMERPIIGANDGASGVAVLMEVANLLKQRQPAVTVHIVLFDGEDYGKSGSLDEYFLGARHFSTNLPSPRPEYAILLDMVGDRDLALPMERNSLARAPDLVRKVWSRAKSLGLSEFQGSPGEVVYDDHIPLLDQGLPAIDIIDFTYPYWHTMADTPDKCSARSLGVVGRLMASIVYKPL
jgi:hypothetical protein